MIIRICTEECGNLPAVQTLINAYFDCYSLFKGVGVWNGKAELSMTIDIAVDAEELKETAMRAARELAQAIKILNKQEAVLVEFIPSTNIMI